jgi:hypothetical protein
MSLSYVSYKQGYYYCWSFGEGAQRSNSRDYDGEDGETTTTCSLSLDGDGGMRKEGTRSSRSFAAEEGGNLGCYKRGGGRGITSFFRGGGRGGWWCERERYGRRGGTHEGRGAIRVSLRDRSDRGWYDRRWGKGGEGGGRERIGGVDVSTAAWYNQH